MSPVILALAAILGTPASPGTKSPDVQLTELVRKLGDKSYRAREDAARALLRHGSAAVAVLNEGIRDTDPEVSERCRQLLPQAAALERNEKLAALLKDPSAPPPDGLAEVGRFLKVTGDTKQARELYAELLAVHHQTLELVEQEPAKAAQRFREFCEDAYNRWQASIRTGRYSYDSMFGTRADITYFLFLSADNRVRKHDAGVNRSSVMLNGNQIVKAISDSDGAPVMRKLFLDWLENESQTYLQQRGFQMAAQADLKEALPVALKLLEQKNQQPSAKAQLLIALIKLGTKDMIPGLEKHMTDTSVVGRINFGAGNGGQMTVQVRDVAMGVAVQLTGQNLTDFGFDSRFGRGGTSYIYYGFRDDDSRTKAHAKWQEWAKANLSK